MGMLLIFLNRTQIEGTEYLKLEKSLTLLYTTFDSSILLSYPSLLEIFSSENR